MDNKKVKLVLGSLLHDFGKLLYRYNDGRNHSTSGYEFLKGISELENERDMLDCVRYHHSSMIRGADIPQDSLCCITYIADNIASFSDRRKNESGDSGFVRGISFESVFNILNGNDDKLSYPPSVLSDGDGINYPTDKAYEYSEEFYGEIVDKIKDKLRGIEYTCDFANSLLEILEAYTSYIPSSTQTGERRDISLYSHLKLTAALSACIYDYLGEQGITDYKTELFSNAEDFYDRKAFMMFSADISGIQNFIYNIAGKGALKGLRSRSFYLEIVMESAIDELLDRLELTRCNVIYTGGGHTYVLLPCTEKARNAVSAFETELNRWFLDNFGTDLYIGTGLHECTANSFRGKPDGAYKDIFVSVSRQISEKKLARYSAEQIIALNSASLADNEHECAVCGRTDRLSYDEANERYVCSICSELSALSDDILDGEFFTVLNSADGNEPFVILPFGKYLIADSRESLLRRISEDKRYVRSYCKNSMYSGLRLASKLWVGDYCAKKQLEELAENSMGIRRIAVFRADVDNLGHTFTAGFEDKYATLSRTAELSKKLSMFFKHHINSIMRNGVYCLEGGHTGKRNAVIIYSGGDDVFVVGGWDDVIGFAVDLREALKKYSQNTLKISGGIGLYPPKYPLYAMAEETGSLEECSKSNKCGGTEKDSITLFDESGCYHWDEFIDKVIDEKLAALNKYLDVNDEKGKAMLYNMLELIRRRNDESRLNLARFAYLLARLAPERDKNGGDDAEFAEKDAAYREFTIRMYSWIQNDEDCRQLVTAIYIYVYKTRTKNNEKEND